MEMNRQPPDWEKSLQQCIWQRTHTCPEYTKTPTNEKSQWYTISQLLESLQLKTLTTLNVNEDVELEVPYFVGSIKWYRHFGICCFFIKLNMHLSCYPTSSYFTFPFLLSIYQYPQKHMYKDMQSSLIHNHQKEESAQLYPFVHSFRMVSVMEAHLMSGLS